MKKYDDIFICTTDTVPGIGGPVNNETLELIYTLKKRPLNKKVIILVGSIEQAQKFAQWTNEATELAKQKWPGAASIIVNDQGFRMPNNQLLIDYLLKNGPIYMSSANISGESVIDIKNAHLVFPEVTKIYDFGPGSGQPSTIYNLDTNEIITRK
ncbi:Sua5/YciO/YrdC/YwlC family protein [Mycoplasma sp. Pen4]|uniref:L-threonylcarbamoyladenylate synthase n=1 Tax=Mycoplasma sp. Pen4 TaxID=640330 RepID=UPI00165425C2|nr:Sua5/YciO/YrdC/YwlC family protein [Mycoplasma sp. Pen4]QNM93490.1 Sua5/YciO/YrdC/YwlC family protein [Mycoplasma sp. Pen4]